MDILMVPRGTGNNPYLDQLADGLSELGHSIRIGTGRPTDVLSYIRNRGVPDVLHIHWLASFIVGDNILATVIKSVVTTLGLVFAQILGIQVIWTAHNTLEHDRRHPRIETVSKRFLTYFLIDRIIVHENTTKKELLETLSIRGDTAEKVRVVPHGSYIGYYPDEIRQDDAREQLGYNDEIVYLFFGMIREYKGVVRLARTFQDLPGKERQLLIVGQPATDDLEHELAGIAAEDGRISNIFEFIPEEDVQIYMRAADVVVLPFKRITTSGSAILAMSFGRPVIAPAIGSLPETLPSDGSFLYSPNTEERLLEALRRAGSADLEEMGGYCRATVETLDWVSIAEKTVQIYTAQKWKQRNNINSNSRE